jgi:hypothetical protein
MKLLLPETTEGGEPDEESQNSDNENGEIELSDH